LKDAQSGVCRIDKTVKPYPVKAVKESCKQWIDAGQQYYIRQGWIKKTLAKEKENG